MRIPILFGVVAAALAGAAVTPASASQPTGSFQASCRGVQVSGGVLTADCRDRRGNYHVSSIPYPRCRGDIGNNDGLLICNGAEATVQAPQDRGQQGRDRGAQDYGGGRPPSSDWNRGPGGYDGGYPAQGGPDFHQPEYGQPGYQDRGRDDYSEYGDPGVGGVYPQFTRMENHIEAAIREGVRDDLIARDDAHELMRQLRDIQAREQREYQVHGWNLPDDDRQRIGEDLRRLDHLIDQIRQEP